MRFRNTLSCFLVLASSVGGVQASTVMLDAKAVRYSFDSENVGFFGSWTLSATGESLEFVPTDFVANVLGAGLGEKAETIAIRVDAKPGYFLIGASLHEQGIYERWAEDAPSLGETGASVSGSFEIGTHRTELSTDQILDQGNIAPVGPEAFPWSLDRSLNVGASNSFTINLSNSLFVWSFSPDAKATIQKTLTILTADAAPVPLPSSFMLLGLAIMAVLFIAPRKLRDPDLT